MATETQRTSSRSYDPAELDAEAPWRRRARRLAGRFRYNRLAMVGATVTGTFLLVALLAPTLAPYDPTAMDVPNRLSGPSLAHPFGTDQYGRDVLSRALVGSRAAMKVAFAVPLVAASVGVPIGLLAGYFGGWIDNALMRVMDAIFAFPAGRGSAGPQSVSRTPRRSRRPERG